MKPTKEHTVKYLLQVISFNDAPIAEGEGPTVEELIGYKRAMLSAGVLVDSGFLDDHQPATTVQVGAAGEQIITNGPFPQTREHLRGWDVIDVPDLDAALEWAARNPVAKSGRVEIRSVVG